LGWLAEVAPFWREGQQQKWHGLNSNKAEFK
jgi:hypothetical protein